MRRLNPRPTYDEFRQQCLIPNEPCIISNGNNGASHSPLASSTGLAAAFVHHWPAYDTWLTSNKHEIDYDNLTRLLGDVTVSPVTQQPGTSDCNDREINFGDLLDQWRNGLAQNVYLKDWHLPLMLSKRTTISQEGIRLKGEQVVQDLLYKVPNIVRDDWMNEYYGQETEDDFRFVYAGGGDTVTLLHRDVYASYSVSTNIFGRKRWYMFPPQCTPHLQPYISAARYNSQGVDVRTWSQNTLAQFHQLGMLVVEQEQAETIFGKFRALPSGWYHQVVNLTHPTISLNHNWCNAHNILSMYKSMSQEVEDCRDAISDVKQMLARNATAVGKHKGSETDWRFEWETCVQDLVRQNAGWDWKTFWSMIKFALRRMIDPDEWQATDRWPMVEPSLRPPPAFVLSQVEPCLKDFCARPEEEHRFVAGLNEILQDVSTMVNDLRLASDNNSLRT
ncbi:hypothetical protein OIV83_004538 [Microbotryomycetes sp. JL201]|nr:hypothetical protein OIV83_004538 [Microbotryomycetes sp. JL201]